MFLNRLYICPAFSAIYFYEFFGFLTEWVTVHGDIPRGTFDMNMSKARDPNGHGNTQKVYLVKGRENCMNVTVLPF